MRPRQECSICLVRRAANHKIGYVVPDAQLKVLCDGLEAPDTAEAWAGTPGRVIRYQGDGGPCRLCPCRPPFKYADVNGEVRELPPPGIWRQLIEYDEVVIVRTPNAELPPVPAENEGQPMEPAVAD